MRNSSTVAFSPDARAPAAILTGALLVALYFCGGKLGLSLASINASTSAVWPPAGIALAALVCWGLRLWPAVFLGAFLVNITTQGSVGTSLGIAAGNTLEALLGAWLVNRFAGGVHSFDRTQNVLKFVALAAIVATAISATVGVTSLCIGNSARWDQFGPIWLTWWLGDMVSDLLIAPLIMIWWSRPAPRLSRNRILEALALFLAIMLVGAVVFPAPLPFLHRNFPNDYLALLPLLWAAFRFGQQGAATASVLTSGLALAGTLSGFGPFVKPDPNQSLLLVQAFVGTITITALLLATVVSDRTSAILALRESEERLRLAQHLTQIGTFDWNIQTGVNRWTPELEAMYGLKPGSFQGTYQAWESMVHPSDRPEAVRQVAAAIGQGNFDAEWRVVWPDGTLRWLAARASVLKDDSGNPLRLIGVNIDITAQKRADEALAHAQGQLRSHAEQLERTVAERTAELRRINSELEAFSYSLSHDLRAPLRGIKGFATVVLEEHRSALGPEATSLEKVIRAADRMDRLIQDVLAFSRVSRQEIRVEPVDVESLLRAIIQERLELHPPAAQIEIQTPLPRVKGDAASLTQCITNLLDNAVKFTPRGTIPRVRIRGEPISGTVRLWFEDNGIGIEPAAQEKIFELFERGSANGQFEGTGIGLAIVRRAVERMAGAVGVESAPGAGSRFWLELPKA